MKLENSKKEIPEKRLAIGFFIFGTYLSSMALFRESGVYVPDWTLYSLAGIFFMGTIIYMFPMKVRKRFSLLFITLINIFIIISLIGIGFYGTGGCSMSGGGVTTTYTEGDCVLPGYIGIVWAIGLVVYLVKKIFSKAE